MAGHDLLSATPTASLAVFYTGFSYLEEDKLGSIVYLSSSNVEIHAFCALIKMLNVHCYSVYHANWVMKKGGGSGVLPQENFSK